jgi:multicomponent Na+:H+ antiporter subunit E
MLRQLVCLIFTFLLWVLLTWSVAPEDLVVGLFFSVLIGTFLSAFYPERVQKALDPRRWFWGLLYLPYFLYYCVKANFDVAYRVLHVDLPIRPGIVKVRTSLVSEMGRTFLANSITLTPGTLSVDIDGADLYVHWINVATDDPRRQTAQIVGKFEPMLKRIFD